MAGVVTGTTQQFSSSINWPINHSKLKSKDQSLQLPITFNQSRPWACARGCLPCAESRAQTFRLFASLEWISSQIFIQCTSTRPRKSCFQCAGVIKESVNKNRRSQNIWRALLFHFSAVPGTAELVPTNRPRVLVATPLTNVECLSFLPEWGRSEIRVRFSSEFSHRLARV